MDAVHCCIAIAQHVLASAVHASRRCLRLLQVQVHELQRPPSRPLVAPTRTRSPRSSFTCPRQATASARARRPWCDRSLSPEGCAKAAALAASVKVRNQKALRKHIGPRERAPRMTQAGSVQSEHSIASKLGRCVHCKPQPCCALLTPARRSS